MSLIPLPARTESIAEIVIICICRRRFFAVDWALHTRLGIDPQVAGRSGRKTRGAAIADKVAAMEELDESVFTMAGDAARVADRGRCVRVAE